MALLTTTKPAGGSDPPAGFIVRECGPKDEGWEDKRNRWACRNFVFHVKQRLHGASVVPPQRDDGEGFPWSIASV